MEGDYTLEEISQDAEARNWEIFNPNWDYLANFPALSLAGLAGLSVGMHPWFAIPTWVIKFAIPYFEGESVTKEDKIIEKIERQIEISRTPCEAHPDKAKRLREFLQRIHIAVGNLAPLGNLSAVDGNIQSEATTVKVSDFITFANRLGWELPEELTRLQGTATGLKPEAANTGNNDVSGSGLLIKPSRQDDWFQVIDDMTRDFHKEYGTIPNEPQAWGRLCVTSPAGYEITASTDKGGEGCLKMPGVSPLSRSSFNKRWAKYTANSGK